MHDDDTDWPDLSVTYFPTDDPSTDASQHPLLTIRAREVALPIPPASSLPQTPAPSALVLDLIGELEFESRPAAFQPLVRKVLAALASEPSLAALILDLSRLDLIDSLGLKELLLLHFEVNYMLRPVPLVVAVGESGRQVPRIWHLGQFDTILPTVPDLAAALTLASTRVPSPDSRGKANAVRSNEAQVLAPPPPAWARRQLRI